MPSSDKNRLETLRVICPTCHERFDVRLTEKAQSVKCTFCETRISVPSREVAQQQWLAQQPLPAPAVEEYKLSDPPADSSAPRKPGKGAGKTTNGKVPEGSDPPLVLVACPTCHERMRTAVSESPGKIACTYCGTAVHVPGREAVARWKAKQVQPQSKELIGEYVAAAPCERPAAGMHLFDRLAEIRREAPVPPPRWTFFSGVFTFPWCAEALFSWSAITLGFTVLSLLGSFIIGGGMGTGPQGIGIIGMGFFGLPILWITIFTFAYAADCCLCVLESTAYGLDQVEAWPDGGWKEWMPKLIYVSWIAAIPTLVSAGVGRLAEFAEIPYWPVMLGTLFLLYPIALLSALEANSVWVPLTLPIVKTLYLAWSGWLFFYGLTGLLAGGLGVLLFFGVPRFDYIALIPFGPLLAAFLLIYARLLGRLAWKIGQVLTA